MTEAGGQDLYVAYGKNEKGDAAYRLGRKIRDSIKRRGGCGKLRRVYVHTCFSGKCHPRKKFYGAAYALKKGLGGGISNTVYGWEGQFEYATIDEYERKGEPWVPPHPGGVKPPPIDRRKQTVEEWLRKNYINRYKKGRMKSVGSGYKKG